MSPFRCLLLLGVLTSAALAEPLPALRVVTLNTVLTEIAGEVGGGDVRVSGLVQPDVDPHTFEPSAAEIRAVVDADLVLASGLGLESYLDRLVANSGGHGRILSVGDSLPVILSRDPAFGPAVPGGEKDPHWWHSIDNVIAATEAVRREFTRLRPAAAAGFAQRAAAYHRRLLALQAWVATEIAMLPPPRRELLTSHNAFGYFARDYGFRVHAISGLSTDGEPDARHLAGLIDLVRARGIKAVFVEASVNPRFISNLVGETGVRLGGTLYADGLGQGEAATYAGMVRHNVLTLVEGLR